VDCGQGDSGSSRGSDLKIGQPWLLKLLSPRMSLEQANPQHRMYGYSASLLMYVSSANPNPDNPNVVRKSRG